MTTQAKLDSARLALESIAGMRVDEKTDFPQLLALCIAVAKVELSKN